MNIEFKLDNGRSIKARTEEWVAAIMSVLTNDQKRAVFERIDKKLVAYKTPGSYILKAEGSFLGRQ